VAPFFSGHGVEIQILTCTPYMERSIISCHISEFNIKRSKHMCIISVFDIARDTLLLGLILLSISSY